MDTEHNPVRFKGLITFAVMLATAMPILDSTIANIALPSMQGPLNAARDSITWVLTSYIVATAIATPLTGWLAGRIGVKPLLVLAIAGFTFTSLLCGLAQTLEQMVLFRILQGVTGAAMMPLSQAIMLDMNPREKQARAMALWGASVTGVQAFGPTIGGWLTDYYDWRWCFLVNIPLGLLALGIVLVCMYRTPPQPGRRLDFIGYLMLAGFVGALQLMLDRGEQLDWFSSTEIVIEAVVAGLCFWWVLVHTLTGQRPFLNPRLFRDPNFSGALILTFIGFVVFTGSMALLSLMMQQMYGYPVLTAGELMLPRSLAMMVTMLSLGALVTRVDPRLFLIAGLLLQGVSFWVMSGFSLTMGAWPLVWTGILQGVGTALLMVPMNVVMLMTLPADLRPEGAAFSAMTRALGQSVGVSVLVFLLSQNTQVAHADLAAHVTPMVQWWHEPYFNRFAVDPQRLAAVLEATVSREASMIAYINDFYMLAWVCLLMLPMVLLFKVRRAPPGAGPAAPAIAD